MSPLPPETWHTVHMNFCSPFPKGEYLFVVIDAYCRYHEVEIVHSTAARSTILIIVPLHLTTINGNGSNLVDHLFCFLWRINTVSPTRILETLALDLLSACFFHSPLSSFIILFVLSPLGYWCGSGDSFCGTVSALSSGNSCIRVIIIFRVIRLRTSVWRINLLEMRDFMRNILSISGCWDQPDGMNRMFMNSESH